MSLTPKQEKFAQEVASENGHTIGQRGPDGVKLSETGVGPMALQRKGK